jgi:hypothetical protein
MKSRTWKLFYMLGTLAIACTFILLAGQNTKVRAAASHTTSDDYYPSPDLKGTWQVTVTQVSCPNGPTITPVSFPSLLSFAGDETMSENTSSPAFAIGQRGPGLGVWNRDGRRTFQAKSIAFILFTTAANLPGTPGFNPMLPVTPGFTAGTQTITQTIEFGDNPDEFTTTNAAIQFADGGGNVYRNGCATAVAKRFQ